jgi:tRNAThr (cytosine32-N3)-methyltransferase
MAQLRFKKERLLETSFYVRGDGTRVYFFSVEEINRVFTNKANDKDWAGFEEISNGMERRLLVNRHLKLKMYRCFVQARYRKSI